MKIGPKYKIARRLKAPIFEKTQTQKYALRESNRKDSKGGKPKTDFGIQLNEKQKARMFYAVTEKQFAKYVKQALANKKGSPASNLLHSLERRLDNTVWRAGILPTHLSARQAVSHGHFLVNGKKVYVPSFSVKDGDVISIREGSKNSKLFNEIENKVSATQIPSWISWDNSSRSLKIKEGVYADKAELLFDLGQVIEYYQR